MTTRMQILAGLAAVGLVAGLAGPSRADDKKVSVTGTWTWTVVRNDQEMKNTLRIKQEGTKVTGKIESPRGEAEISDGEVKDNVLKFSVTREFGGNKFVIKYTGKVEGDKISLEGEMERDGETRKMGPWDAKRAADKA